MPNVTLYQMPNVVSLTESMGVSVSTVMNRIDFNLYKHVSNKVDFLFKTVDRKPSSFTGLPTIYIVDPRTQQLVLQQTLSPVNIPKGHYQLLIDPTRLTELQNGYFSYSITVADNAGNELPIYMDMNRTMQGWCELFQGHLPAPQNVPVVAGNVFQASSWGNPPVSYLLDPTAHPGAAQSLNRSGLHNLAIYATGYTGTFYIQASLENTAPQSDSDWFTIPESPVTLTAFTGVRSVAFTGNYMWVRFYHLPASGTIDQIMFKN